MICSFAYSLRLTYEIVWILMNIVCVRQQWKFIKLFGANLWRISEVIESLTAFCLSSLSVKIFTYPVSEPSSSSICSLIYEFKKSTVNVNKLLWCCNYTFKGSCNELICHTKQSFFRSFRNSDTKVNPWNSAQLSDLQSANCPHDKRARNLLFYTIISSTFLHSSRAFDIVDVRHAYTANHNVSTHSQSQRFCCRVSNIQTNSSISSVGSCVTVGKIRWALCWILRQRTFSVIIQVGD